MRRSRFTPPLLGLVLGLGAVTGGTGPASADRPAPPAPAGKPAPPGKPIAPVPPPKPGEDPREGREARDRMRAEIFDKMRAERMWRMTEELKLDQATAAKVFPLLATFDEKARTLGHERHELTRELWRELKAEKPEDARLKGLVEKLHGNRSRRDALEQERFRALQKVLTPVQQAKLVLLLPRLEESFKRRIREAWEEQRRGSTTAHGAAEGGPGPKPPRFGPPRP